jgi:hypothetical protein
MAQSDIDKGSSIPETAGLKLLFNYFAVSRST